MIHAKLDIAAEAVSPAHVIVRQSIFEPTKFHIDLAPTTKPAEALKRAKAWLRQPFTLSLVGGGRTSTYKGLITKVTVRPGVIALSGRSPWALLDQAIRSRGFADKTGKEIMEEVFSAYGKELLVCVSGRPRAGKYAYLAQSGQTDMDIIRYISSYEGLLVRDRGGMLVVGPEPEGKVVLSATQLPNGPGMVTIEPSSAVAEAVGCCDETHQSVEASTDGAGMKGLLAEACWAAGKAPGARSRLLVHSRGDAEAMHNLVSAWSRSAAAEVVQYHLETDVPGVEHGAELSLPGHPFVDESDGLLVVAQVVSQWASGEFHSQVLAVPAAVAPGLIGVPTRAALLVEAAEVVSTDDPLKLGRVRLRLPHDVSPGPWARVAHSGAGPGRGSAWTPRVGDEVLVTFLGDQDRPVVLGGLYHAEAPPSFETSNGSEEVILVRTPQGEVRAVESKGTSYLKVAWQGHSLTLREAGEGEPSAALVVQGDVLIQGKNVRIKGETIRIDAEGEAVVAGRTTAVSASDHLGLKANQIDIN